jgi:hypothetical protein
MARSPGTVDDGGGSSARGESAQEGGAFVREGGDLARRLAMGLAVAVSGRPPSSRQQARACRDPGDLASATRLTVVLTRGLRRAIPRSARPRFRRADDVAGDRPEARRDGSLAKAKIGSSVAICLPS